MSSVCQLPTPDALFASVVASTDCVIEERVSQAYAALQAPQTGFMQFTTVVLTIYVAIVGYRLILGYTGLRFAELVPQAIEVGVVLALITSWPAYHTLVFNVLFQGPEELASVVTSPLASGAARGNVLDGLQDSYDRITAVAAEAWSTPSVAVLTALSPSDPFAQAAPDARPGLLPSAGQFGAPQFASMLLWLSAAIMAAASVGTLLVLRIVLALLLLVGPAFIVAGLFPATRGLLEGWLRVSVRYALAPLFVILGSVGLVAVLTPVIVQLEATRERPETFIVLAVALIVAVFTAVLMQAAKLAGGIASGIRLPRGRTAKSPEPPALMPAFGNREQAPLPSLSRTDTLVDAISRSSAQTTERQHRAIAFALQNDRTMISGRSVEARSADVSGRLGQSPRRTAVVQSRRSPAR